jgi:putative FmdB family regulatory protein
MPLYEYRCSACGHQQEFLQKWSDAPLSVCTSCGQATFQKMLTAAGFQLKGSGWYATDFKNSGAKSAAKADTKGDAKPATKSDAKAEPKSEVKADAKSGGDGSAAPSKASGSGGCAASS